jgi:hypothetical protein
MCLRACAVVSRVCVQAVSAAIVSSVLLCVALGWTLASDAALRTPTVVIPGVGTGYRAVAIVTAALHVCTALVGRLYDGEFDQNHSFEHWPGFIMLVLYTVAGAFYVNRLTSLLATMVTMLCLSFFFFFFFSPNTDSA